MKKIVLLLFVVCATLSVNAQVYVGGSLGFWHNDDADATSYSVFPEVGYVLTDQVAIGADFGYASNKANGVKNTAFVIAPYVRYGFLSNEVVSLFVDATAGYAKWDKPDTDGFQAGIKPGVIVKLTDQFSLVTKLGFAGYRDDYDSPIDREGGNGFGLSLAGRDLSFGFVVHF